MRRYILYLYSSFRNNISFIVKYIIASRFCIVDDNKFLPYHFGNKNRVKFYCKKKKKIDMHIIFEHTKDIMHILCAYTYVCMYIYCYCLSIFS